MSAADQAGVRQRTGYVDTAQPGGNVNNDRGFGGPTYQGGQGNYPVQQSYGPNTTNGSYQGQALGPNEYVDKHGNVARRKTRGGKFAACLALCWCCTWPCHGPCCGGL
ncbi:unnamed protein product [Calypogeia fissa]